MQPARRRFVLVMAFELTVLVLATVLLDRLPPIVLGAVLIATVIEMRRFRRAGRGDAPPAPPQHGSGVPDTLVRGLEVAIAAGLDPDSTDPRAVATAYVDIEPGWLDDHPYAIGLHDEVRLLFDEDAMADEDPTAWSAEGPIGDTVQAQPEIGSARRDDREVVHVRPASAEVGPLEIHAAAVRALLELHRRRPGDLTDLD